MKIRSIFDPQKRSRFLSKVRKTVRQVLANPMDTTPVFVLGCQRSGTTMLMFAFHLHPNIAVFDESRSSRAFINFRLRSLELTEKLISECAFPIACFKPLADSHITLSLLNRFPSARCIWMLRDYRDVANSFLRKFPHATRAIRIVCEGKEGGGWFQEGISETTGRILRSLPWDEFSDFDFACLVWWARNSLYFEQKLQNNKQFMVLNYERLVTTPENSLKEVTEFIGTKFSPKMIRYIHAKSISRHHSPSIHKNVQILCDELYSDFNSII